jgi:hypothetical protein
MKTLIAIFFLVSLPCLAQQPKAGSTQQASGSITTGGAFQVLSTNNSSRNSFEFQNLCNVGSNCVAKTDNCYLFFGGQTATATTSIIVAAGGYYLRSVGSIPGDTIQVSCDGTSDKFYGAVQ